ncbi:P-loop containing nucleoside triphosphate hydrolase protein [Blastocladiella britannica]|nr:P-loop containing nucleoside triphosphate hydrolase protein [Blastocladiella britannica]
MTPALAVGGNAKKRARVTKDAAIAIHNDDNGDTDSSDDENDDVAADMDLDAVEEAAAAAAAAIDPFAQEEQQQQQQPKYDLYFPDFSSTQSLSRADHLALKRAALPGWLARPELVAQDDAPTDDDMVPAPEDHAIGAFALDPRLLAVCTRLGLHSLFSIQRAVVPRLLDAHLSRDLLVSAPTGSGKTLSYVLPIVHRLASRTVPRLRALVVVPTRDLVRQVVETVRPFADAVGLRVAGAAAGWGADADKLSGHAAEKWVPTSMAATRKYLAHHPTASQLYPAALPTAPGGHVSIDILIATPGRLHDLLTARGESGFSLQHLQFFVVDEADRILNAGESEWIDLALASMQSPLVLASSSPLPPSPLSPSSSSSVATVSPIAMPSTLVRSPLGGVARRRPRSHPIKLLFSATLTRNPEKLARMRLHDPWMLAAASAEDAAAAASAAGATGAGPAAVSETKYVFPATLHESAATMMAAALKPVMVLELVAAMEAATRLRVTRQQVLAPELPETTNDDEDAMDGVVETVTDDVASLAAQFAAAVPDPAVRHMVRSSLASLLPATTTTSSTPPRSVWRMLVFTNSVDSARQLAKVLSVATADLGDTNGGAPIASIDLVSRELPAADRTALLRKFRADPTGGSTASVPVRVLVASDLLARGIDLPSVDLVVQYDPPTNMPQYVHRVGRTARAGATGAAVTLLAAHEVRWFRQMMREKRGNAGWELVRQFKFRATISNSSSAAIERALYTLGGGDKTTDVAVAEEQEGKDEEDAMDVDMDEPEVVEEVLAVVPVDGKKKRKKGILLDLPKFEGKLTTFGGDSSDDEDA